jgi:glycosyltransferase involved in cell wall biosynthesis
LDDLVPDLTVERLSPRSVNRQQAANLLGIRQTALPGKAAEEFLLAHSHATFRSDAWLALADRFAAPLLPLRPYGVIIYDMIQKYVPTLFPQEFHVQARHGLAPTARLARALVTTNETTQADVSEEYQIDPERLALVPVPCEPHVRFGNLVAEHVDLPPKPFILNVANAGPHKGAAILLRAMARLKARMGEKTPLLVVCGYYTERFAPSYQGAVSNPHWQMVRRLVLDLNLKEGKDVVFLGYTGDHQLVNLFERCAAVVNAAKYDNGTFSLIEGHYFGRPVLSSSYPAAEALYRRFEVPVRYFPIDDDHDLARLLEQTVNESPLEGETLVRVRRHLADPRFGSRRYAEQVYELLVRLCREGRAERLARGPAQSHSVRAA